MSLNGKNCLQATVMSASYQKSAVTINQQLPCITTTFCLLLAYLFFTVVRWSDLGIHLGVYHCPVFI